jgi:hypothetical protein
MGIVEAPASDRPDFTAIATLWLKVPGSREFVHPDQERRGGRFAPAGIATGLLAVVLDLR